MSYKISASERTKSICAEYEAKALLYLMSCRSDSNKIFYFIVDVFNDLTGHDENFNECWDVQSKGYKTITYNKIGHFLVTLFKNYMSDFNFAHPILFLAHAPDVGRNINQNYFKYADLDSKYQRQILKGLKSEIPNKEYTANLLFSDDQLIDFISSVLFVIADKESVDYVKTAIKLNKSFIPSKEILQDIFDNIKKEQQSKKDCGLLEGIELNSFEEADKLKRTIKSSEVDLMILNEILSTSILKGSAPMEFSNYISDKTLEEKIRIRDDCRDNINLTLFDKNKSKLYWKFLNQVFLCTTKNVDKDLDYIFNLIDPKYYQKLKHLDDLTIKYLIALVQEAYYENK